MAKYLDQAGVQHLTEALVQNTKTIGGQTIWGSGNIEAGELPVIDINDPSEVGSPGQIAFYRLNYTGNQAPQDVYIGYATWDNSDKQQLIITGVTNHRQYIVEISDTVIWNEITDGVINIKSAEDFTTYKTQLESKIPKTVSIESGDYDLSGQTIGIYNATLRITGNVKLKNATQIGLFECTTGVYEPDPVYTAGALLYINAGRITFNRCQITLRTTPLLENSTNLSAEYISINDSRLKIIPLTYGQFNNGTPNIVNSGITIVHSECIGLVPDSTSTIVFRDLGDYTASSYIYLCNTMISCNFLNMSTFNNNNACVNTRFIGCLFKNFGYHIYNVTQSWVPSAGRIFAGPVGTSLTAREYGFNNILSDV